MEYTLEITTYRAELLFKAPRSQSCDDRQPIININCFSMFLDTSLPRKPCSKTQPVSSLIGMEPNHCFPDSHSKIQERAGVRLGCGTIEKMLWRLQLRSMGCVRHKTEQRIVWRYMSDRTCRSRNFCCLVKGSSSLRSLNMMNLVDARPGCSASSSTIFPSERAGN